VLCPLAALAHTAPSLVCAAIPVLRLGADHSFAFAADCVQSERALPTLVDRRDERVLVGIELAGRRSGVVTQHHAVVIGARLAAGG